MGHSRPQDNYLMPEPWKTRFQLGGIAMTIVGLGIGSAGWFLDAHRFWFSFHVAFLFFMTITLGALAFITVNYVTRTKWNVVYRRFAENLSMNIFLMALLAAILYVFGGHDIFHHWMEFDPSDHLMVGKEPYLNTSFFSIRAIAFFAIWIILAVFYYSNSIAQDNDGDYRRTQLMQRISSVGVIIMALTITFFGFDWSMSLDPHWFSTMFGVYIIAGSFLAIHGSLILIKFGLHQLGLLKNTLTVEHDHDLGKYIMGFTIFWGYIAYSQFMLIWYANIPEETVWFHHRWEGSWKYMSIFLIFGKFFFPFLALLSRHVKKNPYLLLALASWVLFMHYIDLYWQVMPVYSTHGIPLDKGLLVDVLAIVGLGLAYKGLFLSRLSRKALVPMKDPRLKSSLEFENF